VGADLLAFTASRDQRAAEEADQYLKQQIQDLELGRRLVNLSKQDIQRRERAVDNLKALGPAAIPAVPALAWAAVNVPQTVVARKAIELLGEIGGHQGVAPICQSLHRRSYDPSEIDRADIGNAVREVLLKLLPTVGRGLTMDDAISLWEMLHYFSRLDKRLYAVTVSAWEASGIEPAAVAKEILSRGRAKHHTLKGMDRFKQPPPSPMNWRLLTECELAESANGLVNMQRKSAKTLWAEEHPGEYEKMEKEESDAKSARRERNANKEGSRGNWDNPKTENQLRQEMIDRQNRERAANRVR
jgi:hypothetical protein